MWLPLYLFWGNRQSENGNRLIAFDKHLIFNENQRSCPQRVPGKESYQNISKALSQAMYRRNLMPARRAVRWRAWRATGAVGCTIARGNAGTHGGVFTFSHLGNQLMSLFRFAFRAYGVRLFAEAQRNHFKLFFAFIAFKFVYRHNFLFLTFSFNLEIKTENVNTCKVIRACNCPLT